MREKILALLKQQDGFVSGQSICEALGVSRTAVWKVINTLKTEGYEIESVTRKGYRLLQSPDFITEEAIRSYLSADVWPGEIHYDESVDSTNEEAKRQAAQGAADGSVFVADHQTAGRGRRGRVWESPGGEDIFFTILLRPDLPAESATMITLLAALCVAAAADRYVSPPCQIKWPNDVICHDKKLCGILTEMSLEMGEIAYVAVGIGVNVNRLIFSDDIDGMATSLRRETGERVVRAELLARILTEFAGRYAAFLREGSLASFLEEYEQRLINIGREVRIVKDGREQTLTALGINDRGELLARTPAGKVERIFTGEVSVRGLYGYV